jgi:hypothetical protein
MSGYEHFRLGASILAPFRVQENQGILGRQALARGTSHSCDPLETALARWGEQSQYRHIVDAFDARGLSFGELFVSIAPSTKRAPQ